MASSPSGPKILGQEAVSANALTVVYTATKKCIVGAVIVTNRGGSDSNFRLAIAPHGAADDPSQYLYYGQELKAVAAFPASIGVELEKGDVIRVRAGVDASCQVLGSYSR